MLMTLSSFKEKLFTDEELPSDVQSGKLQFQVLGVYMYLADKDVQLIFKDRTKTKTFIYDVTITDGEHRLTCLLDLELGHLVQSSKLRAGIIVEIVQAKRVKYINDDVICLTKLKVLSPRTVNLPRSVLDIPPLPGSSVRAVKQLPLVSSCCTYLNVWATHCPYGEDWNQPVDCLSTNVPSVDPQSFKSDIRGLSETFHYLAKPYPRLLVRILFKGKLHYYGRPDKNHRCPFQGYYVIGDHTGLCTLVVWDGENVGSWNQLQPGDLITLKGYLTADCYLGPDKVSYLSSLEGLPPKRKVQVKVNKIANIGRCSLRDVQAFHGPGVTLPMVQYKFSTHIQIRAAPAESYVDVVGLVLHSGNLMREPMLDGCGFWAYQWLKLADHTQAAPLCFKFYLHDMEHVLPNSVVAITRAKVCRTPIEGQRTSLPDDQSQNESMTGNRPPEDSVENQAVLYLVNIAQSTVHFYKRNTACSDEVIRQTLSWSETQSKESNTIGGLDVAPFHFPPDLRAYFEEMTKPEKEKAQQLGYESWLTSLRNSWQDVWKRLSFREQRRLLFIGQLNKVELVTFSQNSQDPSIITLWQNVNDLVTAKNHDFVIRNNGGYVFPSVYECKEKKELSERIKFPAFSSEQLHDLKYRCYVPNKLPPEQSVSERSFLCMNLHSDGIPLQSFYFPEPSCLPGPTSLAQMLRHQYSRDDYRNWTTFKYYTEEWQDMISSTSCEMWGKEFLFVLDFVSLAPSCQVAVLRHVYDIPQSSIFHDT